MRLRCLLLALTLSIPLASLAASFDCARARTPVERMICADPALGGLDEQIDARYREVSGRLDAAWRARLLASQRR